MDASTSQDDGSTGGADPDDNQLDRPVEDRSGTRNSVTGSVSALVQANNIGELTQNQYAAPASSASERWLRTGLFGLVLVLAVTLLVVVVLDDDDSTATPPQPVPTSDSAGTTAPLHVAVDPVTDPCRSDWFTPRSAEEVRALHTGGDPRAWPDLDYLADGAIADHGQVLVTLQALHADRSVTITDIAVEVVDRRPPPPGIVLNAPCGDPPLFRLVEIDLDAQQPRAVGKPVDPNAVQEAQSKGWRVDPVAVPYEITSTDAETFLLSARTASCDCTWIAHFEWASGDRTGTLTVPGDGATPFRVVSGANAPRCSTNPGLVCR
ncbi:hypothetical protein GCM10023148_08020 [Actinokineospora soli]